MGKNICRDSQRQRIESSGLFCITRVEAIERPARARYRITPKGTELLAQYPGDTAIVLRSMAKPGDEWWRASPKILMPWRPLSMSRPTLYRWSRSKPGWSAFNPMSRLICCNGYRARSRRSSRTRSCNCWWRWATVGRMERRRSRSNRTMAGSTGSSTGTRLVWTGSISRRSVMPAQHRCSVRRCRRRRALSGKATTGVFLTTGRFSQGAQEYAQTAHTRVILIDGRRLTELMIRYGVGVNAARLVCRCGG